MQLVCILGSEVLLSFFRYEIRWRVKSICCGLFLETRQLSLDAFNQVRLLTDLLKSKKDARRHFQLWVEVFTCFRVIDDRLVYLQGVALLLPILCLLTKAFGLHFIIFEN